MQAYVVHKWGDIDELHLETVNSPIPRDQEVVIRVAAVSLNPIDYVALAGGLHNQIQLPAVLGWDVSGIVESVGEDETTFKVGDEVMGLVNFPAVDGKLNGNGYGQLAAVPARQLIKKPLGLSFAEAAALPAVGLTAWQALHDVAGIKADQRILIHGGAGGLGHMSIQIAKNAGAYVIATAKQQTHDFVRSLGADEVIDYTSQDFTQHAQAIDVVFDTVGGEVMRRSLDILVPGGTLVTAMWPQLHLVKDEALERGLHAASVSVIPHVEQLSKLAQQIARKSLQVHVDTVYAFHELPEALRRLRTGGVRGKLVVQVSDWS